MGGYLETQLTPDEPDVLDAEDVMEGDKRYSWRRVRRVRRVGCIGCGLMLPMRGLMDSCDI